MRIDAHSVEDLINKSEDKKESLIMLNQVIFDIDPSLERWLLVSTTYAMIGYGHSKKFPGYPILCVAPQKNFISLYVSGKKNEVLFTSFYKEKLGKIEVGKTCIHIKNMKKINIVELKNLFIDCLIWDKSL